MSPYVFLALCILGNGFMTYAFFQRTHGNKRSTLARQQPPTRRSSGSNRTVHALSLHKGPVSYPGSYPTASASASTEAGRLIPAQVAPTTNDSLEHDAMRSCDQGE
jgi:hypothetical protein